MRFEYNVPRGCFRKFDFLNIFLCLQLFATNKASTEFNKINRISTVFCLQSCHFRELGEIAWWNKTTGYIQNKLGTSTFPNNSFAITGMSFLNLSQLIVFKTVSLSVDISRVYLEINSYHGLPILQPLTLPFVWKFIIYFVCPYDESEPLDYPLINSKYIFITWSEDIVVLPCWKFKLQRRSAKDQMIVGWNF